jgi:hypothetical protein
MRVAGTLILLSFLVGVLADVGEPEYVPYVEFLRDVRNGNIVSVELDKFSRITGVRTVAGKESKYTSFADTGSANDPLLTDLLKTAGVKVTISEKGEQAFPFTLSGLSSLLMIFAIPVATLVYVLKVRKELKQLHEAHQKAQAELMQRVE